jgi:signal transduction histidine kinase
MAVRLIAETSQAQQRHDRMIAAFARAASSIACQGSLQAVLDHLAEEARAVTGAHTCVVSLRSRLSDTFDLLGAAGSPGQYEQCLEQARALGAPLATQEVYRTGAPLISELDTVLRDTRLAPLVDVVRRTGWRTLAAVPLAVRGETVGALTVFYTEGYQPTLSDVSFLTAMADHGALAVHTAQLLAQAKDKAVLEERAHMARDLHDAVSQLLFSMQLRGRALQLEADRGNSDIARISAGLKELNMLTTRAVDEMRTLILHLRPTELREHELVPALRRLAESVQAREKVLVTVQAADDVPPLPS